LLPEVKDPNIIKPQDVIGMGVRKEHGVQAVHAFTQSLRAKVRCRINHQSATVEPNEQRGSRPLIARIG
jgi:phage head maturation protease